MAGYTPAFDSIYDGTLYGRWPAAAVMATLIPLIDAKGCINRSFEAIAGMTGWPMELLKRGIEELEQPDPHSRTPAEDGRRLIKLDPARPWGWRVVNHMLYREKARKMAYDKERTESGRDAERKRAERENSRDVPTSPDESRDVPLSDSYADSEAKKTRARAAHDSPDAKTRGDAEPPPGLDPAAWSRWCDYRVQIRKPIKPVSIPAAQRELAGFGADQAAVVEQSIANSYQGLFALKNRPKPQTPVPRRELPDAFDVARRGNGG